MLEGLFRLLGYERRARMDVWSPEVAAIFGAVPTAAGVAVSGESALQSPTTLAATRVISETVAELPIHLYERGSDGSRERNNDHPAAKVLGGDWAPWAGGVETRTAIQLDALLHGAGYGEVLRAGGRPKEIHRLDPRCTSIDWSGGEPVFKTKANGVERRLSWRDVLYIPTPGSAPGRPLCLVTIAREAIGIDMVMAQHQAKLFANGARPSGILKAGSNKLSLEAIKNLKASWESIHAGGANSGKTAILEDGMDFKELQFNSVDSQFLELRRFTVQEIARVFKVPLTLVGDFDRATWRNVEELQRQFLQTCLLPWLEVWQAALSRVLLTPAERETMFLEFVVDDLLRGDVVGRFTAYRNAVGGAWLTPNEARQRENLPPIKGGEKLIMQAGQGAAQPPDDPAQDPEPAPALKAVA